MPGIGIITNPHSKSNKRHPRRSNLLSYIVGKKGCQEVTNSLEDLGQVARQFQEQDIDILAINGGDGTISHTISAFIKCYGPSKPLPKILLLGGGTMNVLASNLGIKGTPEHILTRIVEAVSMDTPLNTVEMSTISIDNQHGFLYADGTSVNLLEEFYKKKAGVVRGAMLGIKLSFSSLIRGSFFKRMIRPRNIEFHPFPYSPIRHATIGTYASTLARMPLGLPMFGKKVLKGQKFRAISISMPPHKLVFRFLRVSLYSKQGYFKGKYNFDAKRLRIQGEESFNYTLDGEVFTSKENQVTISSGKTLEFIVL